MARARKRSPRRTEWNSWIKNFFLLRSGGTLCGKLKLRRNIEQAEQAKHFLLPIKIATEPWALSRWTRMEIWPQQPQPVGPPTSDRGAWVIRRSLVQELTRTMRRAPFPRQATESISFGRRSGTTSRH